MYWAFSVKACPSTHQYYSMDLEMCFDSCDIRYYQNEDNLTCEKCYYTCYTCTNSTNS